MIDDVTLLHGVGIAFMLIGVAVWLLYTPKKGGRASIKMPYLELSLPTDALIIFLVGALFLALPHLWFFKNRQDVAKIDTSDDKNQNITSKEVSLEHPLPKSLSATITINKITSPVTEIHRESGLYSVRMPKNTSANISSLHSTCPPPDRSKLICSSWIQKEQSFDANNNFRVVYRRSCQEPREIVQACGTVSFKARYVVRDYTNNNEHGSGELPQCNRQDGIDEVFETARYMGDGNEIMTSESFLNTPQGTAIELQWFGHCQITDFNPKYMAGSDSCKWRSNQLVFKCRNTTRLIRELEIR